MHSLSPLTKQNDGTQSSGLGTKQVHSQAGHRTLSPLPHCHALARGTEEFISITRPFMQQARGFQVIHTASKTATGHYSRLIICDELSTWERRQWYCWNGNPIRELMDNIRRWVLFLRNSPWEIRKLLFLKICAISFLRLEPRGSNYICILFKPEFFPWNSLFT